jgi:D-alanyl-lipoteichoic acid acyltransferase DltB (MBOAT superfamily)
LPLTCFKVVILGATVCCYDYSEHMHPYFVLVLYCCHMYLGLELVLALCASPVRTLFGFEIEPQFNEPYLSTSLQDFWGHRWNLMVTRILRLTIYNPIRRVINSNVGSTWANYIATLATLLCLVLCTRLFIITLHVHLPRGKSRGGFLCYMVCVLPLRW